MEARLEKVAILTTHVCERVELTKPRAALNNAGARMAGAAIKPGRIQEINHPAKGAAVAVNRTLDAAKSEDSDALMVPGGSTNPDALRSLETAPAQLPCKLRSETGRVS